MSFTMWVAGLTVERIRKKLYKNRTKPASAANTPGIEKPRRTFPHILRVLSSDRLMTRAIAKNSGQMIHIHQQFSNTISHSITELNVSISLILIPILFLMQGNLTIVSKDNLGMFAVIYLVLVFKGLFR